MPLKSSQPAPASPSVVRFAGSIARKLASGFTLSALVLLAAIGGCRLFTYMDTGAGAFERDVIAAARIQPDYPVLKLLPVTQWDGGGAALVSGERQGRREFSIEDHWVFVYDRFDPNGRVDSRLIPISRRFVTDFASIPFVARGLISPVGRVADAAIVHDWLYAVGENASDKDRQQSRKEADQAFYAIMVKSEVDPNMRAIVYTAVRLFGDGGYGLDADWRRGFYDSYADVRLPSEHGCVIDRPASAFQMSAADYSAQQPPRAQAILESRADWDARLAKIRDIEFPQLSAGEASVRERDAARRRLKKEFAALLSQAASDANAESALLLQIEAEKLRYAREWRWSLQTSDCTDLLIAAKKRQIDQVFGLNQQNKKRLSERLTRLQTEFRASIGGLRTQIGRSASETDVEIAGIVTSQESKLAQFEDAIVNAKLTSTDVAVHLAETERQIDDYLISFTSENADPDDTASILAAALQGRRVAANQGDVD